MNRILRTACVSAVTAFVSGGLAQAAPAQLMNKTITVSFGISIPARGSDGSTINAGRQTMRQIYVSSQGRTFVKVQRRAGRNSDSKEVGPGDSGARSFRFAGNKMIGVLMFASGANQMTITFDPSFSSCTVDLVVGAENGKPLVWKGLNGMMLTSTGKPSVSGQSCSISQGNAFAN